MEQKYIELMAKAPESEQQAIMRALQRMIDAEAIKSAQVMEEIGVENRNPSRLCEGMGQHVMEIDPLLLYAYEQQGLDVRDKGDQRFLRNRFPMVRVQAVSSKPRVGYTGTGEIPRVQERREGKRYTKVYGEFKPLKK